ncbi:MAG: tRNA (N6-threonylcarbamoyladenosine(37)-N6)-methyltransferase TrmO [Nitrososphaeria archaeon]|nr:tRNA (N6-threonylcarbamoyladenosine(37)-N6)-methyltransferase TrmO [Nitrososphaeria archaeon]
MEAYQIYPVGVVHINVGDDVVRMHENLEGVIEVFEEFSEALYNIEGFSHLILITFLDRIDLRGRRVLKVRLRRAIEKGVPETLVPEVGVFACDSPNRPNPIGVSIVEVLKVKGRFIFVRGLDVFDGTPVIDIKPYTPYRRVEKFNVPGWFSNIIKCIGREP